LRWADIEEIDEGPLFATNLNEPQPDWEEDEEDWRPGGRGD